MATFRVSKRDRKRFAYSDFLAMLFLSFPYHRTNLEFMMTFISIRHNY